MINSSYVTHSYSRNYTDACNYQIIKDLQEGFLFCFSYFLLPRMFCCDSIYPLRTLNLLASLADNVICITFFQHMWMNC